MRTLAMAGVVAGGILLVAVVSQWTPRSTPPRGVAEGGIQVVDQPQPQSASQVTKDSPTTASAAPPTIAAATTETVPPDLAMEAGFPDPAMEPRVLYARLRSEPRDRDWATRTEQGVRAALSQIPDVNGDGAARVSCGATLCEVRGSVPDGISQERQNAAMQALQGEALQRPLAAAGLDYRTANFGGGAGRKAGYTLYFVRK